MHACRSTLEDPTLRISRLTAQLLVNRGVREVARASAFLRPELKSLIDPSKFAEMPKAVARIEKAIRANEKIGIFGDYDVDGTTGTAILFKFFRLLGKGASYRVPHRLQEGYGLNAKAVEDFAADGVKLIITVDCGTNNHAEIELARTRGIDVIVIDHHESPKEPSKACALINPKAEEGYPFKGICSAGIAFKLAWALSTGLNQSAKLGPAFRGFLMDAMGYVALGTVADVSPIIDENRVFVSFGLEALRACTSPGVRALLDKAGLDDKPIDTWDIGFKLAPRLNAVGRMGTAQDTVDLLVSEDPIRISQVITILESSNRARKGVEDDIVAEALEQIAKTVDLERDRVIIVASEKWHLGVVGIVAARIVDRFARPAIVLSISDGIAKGSARSIEGFKLHEALESVRELLISGGGHAMAAGLAAKLEDLPTIRQRLNRYADEALLNAVLEPAIDIDEEVDLSTLTAAVVDEVGRLAPHGEGNPAPVLVASHVRLAGEPRLMGKKNDHISFLVKHGEGPALRAVGFGMGKHFDEVAAAKTLSLAFSPTINEWRGYRNVELRIEDIKFA